ncbi:MAG TPA: triose-phosphate isomerase [Candidatus Limnocylindrales bacterium]
MPLVGTSWKMHFDSSEAGTWFTVARGLLDGVAGCEVFVLPPFTALWLARERLTGSRIAWGAQDVHGDEAGAHTGDVSAAMLADLGCTFVEVGHSERRRDHGETDATVARKVRQVVRHGMTPILCVGEPEPGPSDAAVRHVAGQLEHGLAELDRIAWPGVVVAYEPVWAIGEGARAARPEHVGAVQRAIHDLVETAGGADARVIYGGSVDETTAGAILAEDGVDGLFVGRAALDPRRFAAIVGVVVRGASAPAGA